MIIEDTTESVIEDESYRCLIKAGIEKDLALLSAREITKSIFTRLKGQNVYFAKKVLKECEALRKKIIDEYDGTNVNFLVEKYDLTQASIYKITKHKRDSKMMRDIHELAAD